MLTSAFSGTEFYSDHQLSTNSCAQSLPSTQAVHSPGKFRIRKICIPHSFFACVLYMCISAYVSVCVVIRGTTLSHTPRTHIFMWYAEGGEKLHMLSLSRHHHQINPPYIFNVKFTNNAPTLRYIRIYLMCLPHLKPHRTRPWCILQTPKHIRINVLSWVWFGNCHLSPSEYLLDLIFTWALKRLIVNKSTNIR